MGEKLSIHTHVGLIIVDSIFAAKIHGIRFTVFLIGIDKRVAALAAERCALPEVVTCAVSNVAAELLLLVR